MSQCTFRPQIGRGTARIVAGRRRSLSAPRSGSEAEESGPSSGGEETDGECVDSSQVSRRLYGEAEQRSVQHQWLQQQIQEARLAQFSFKPQLNPHSRQSAAVAQQPPLHERLLQVQREKKERLQELRQAVEAEQQFSLTFSPAIDERSRRLAERKFRSIGGESPSSSAARARRVLGLDRDVATRLLDAGRGMTRHKLQLLKEQERALEESMEAPVVSRGTKQIARTNKLVRSVITALLSCSIVDLAVLVLLQR